MNEDKGQKGSGRDLRRLLQFLKRKKKNKEIKEQEEKTKETEKEKLIVEVVVEEPIKKEIISKEKEEAKTITIPIKQQNLTEDKKEKEEISQVSPIPFLNEIKEKTKPLEKNETEIQKENEKKEKKEQQESPKKHKEVKPTPIIIPIPPIIKENETEKQEEIKIEEKEEIEEKIIESTTLYQKFEKEIQKTESKVKDLEYDLYTLENRIDKEKDNEEIQKDKEKIKEIQKELENLKKKLDIELLDKNQNKELYQELTDYIENVNTNIILFDLEHDPSYIKITKKIEEILEKTEETEDTINDKEKENSDTENKLEQTKEKYNDVERINEELYITLSRQEKIASEIKQKVAECERYEDRIRTIYVGMNDTATNLLLTIGGSTITKGLPKLLFTALSIKNSFKLFHSLINPKTKKEHYQERIVDDYRNMISYSLNDIESTKKEVRNAISSIDELIIDIKSLPYIPYEYKDLLYNLNTLKENIEDQQLQINKLKSNVENSYEKNKMKLLSK